jgi:5-methylcytosine-specific restriction protein A
VNSGVSLWGYQNLPVRSELVPLVRSLSARIITSYSIFTAHRHRLSCTLIGMRRFLYWLFSVSEAALHWLFARVTLMPQRPPRYCPPGLTRRPAPSEVARPTAAQRGYGSAWQRFRVSYLAEHPLCVPCSEAGRVEEATCIDHKDGKGPLGERGYDPANLTAMCATCHAKKTVKHDGGLGRSPESEGR